MAGQAEGRLPREGARTSEVGQSRTGPIEDPRAERLAADRLAGFRVLRGDSPDKHYPAAARQAALDGLVVVDVLINESGQVLEAQVIRESPEGQGFGIAALDTAKTFEFENPLRRWVIFTLNIEFLP